MTKFIWAIQFWFLQATEQVKGKTIPLQAWKRPEGFRRLRLTGFKAIGT
jgi:hypothetical protein